LYTYVILYLVSSNKEPAREEEKSSVRDANVFVANVQPKLTREVGKKESLNRLGELLLGKSYT